MSLAVEVDRLSLRYGDVTALDNLTFTVDGGKIYGLLGRNGSGKTSLLSVLAAFRKQSEGSVRVGGQPVFENRAITRQVCLIRESGDTVEDSERVSSALEFAEYARLNWDATYAASLLDRFGVDPGMRIRALSRGKRSALGVTLGLASRAPLTMFDESHLGMDAPSRYTFYDALLADFMAHPRTIIVSTHLIDELSSVLEEVLILDKGRLMLQEETESLRERGAAVTGAAEAVDRFTGGLRVLHERVLGRTKSATVFGALDQAQRDIARRAGLDLEPIGLQDLFVHLTQPNGGGR